MFKKIKKIFRNKKKLLILIFILALLLRVVKLGSFPVGFHADEVRVAWNSLSILETGRDDKGVLFPLYYNTFGDYRPTGIFYFTAPFIALFGKNEFAVRFPSSLIGALSIFPLYLFVREFLIDRKDKKKSYEIIAILSSAILAISPWHIAVSRATSEVCMSTFFALFSLYFLIKTINSRKKKFLFYTAVSIFISYLLYHAVRFLAPLFFLSVISFYWMFVWKGKIKKKAKKLSYIAFAFVVSLTLFFSTTPEAKQRFNQVSIFNDIDVQYQITRLSTESIYFPLPIRLIEKTLNSKPMVYLARFVSEYGDYFDTDFLIGHSARPYRYTSPGYGLLGYLEVGLLLFGFIQIIRGKRNFLPLILLLIAPLPASLTTEDTPNLHRAFFMIIFIAIIEAYGIYFLINLKKFGKPIALSIASVLFAGLVAFNYQYYFHSANHKPFLKNFVLDNPSYRNFGTKELALKIESTKGNYEKIIITNQPDDIYPWYAFFTNKKPGEFNKFAVTRSLGSWQYDNIVFSQSKCPSDDSFSVNKEKKLLVIDSGECAYQAKIKDGLSIKVTDKILRVDGTEVYVFLERI